MPALIMELNYKKKQFLLLPVFGLCNRMRAIDSAIAFTQEFKYELIVLWDKNEDCGIDFHDLFCNNKHFEIIDYVPNSASYLHSMKFQYVSYLSDETKISRMIKRDYPKIQKEDFDKKFIEEMNLTGNISENHTHIFIMSCHRFYANENKYKSFRLLPHLSEKILTYSEGLEESIGLHIRRVEYLGILNNKSLDIFIRAIEKEISKDHKARFFLSTDCHKTKEIFKRRFLDRVKFIKHKSLNRNDKAGMISAVIDLYSLSKTKKIFGSYFSTYSLTAAEIGDIQLVVNN